MSLNLRCSLCEARDTLQSLRAMLLKRGHAKSMRDFDSLLGVAESEVIRAIREIDRKLG